MLGRQLRRWLFNRSSSRTYRKPGSIRPSLTSLEERATPALITWIGNDSVDPTAWSNDANWAGGVEPGPNDTAWFNGSALNDVVVDTNVTVQGVTMDNQGVELVGQSDAASSLIPLLEASDRLERVEFTSPVTKAQNKEQFRIRAAWERPPRDPAGPREAAKDR